MMDCKRQKTYFLPLFISHYIFDASSLLRIPVNFWPRLCDRGKYSGGYVHSFTAKWLWEGVSVRGPMVVKWSHGLTGTSRVKKVWSSCFR